MGGWGVGDGRVGAALLLPFCTGGKLALSAKQKFTLTTLIMIQGKWFNCLYTLFNEDNFFLGTALFTTQRYEGLIPEMIFKCGG